MTEIKGITVYYVNCSKKNIMESRSRKFEVSEFKEGNLQINVTFLQVEDLTILRHYSHNVMTIQMCFVRNHSALLCNGWVNLITSQYYSCRGWLCKIRLRICI